MPFWLGLYFSQFTESVRQIPSSAAELCKAVSYLVSSMPGCLHLVITFNGFRCPSDTSLFTCTRRSLDWVYSAQETGWFSPSAGRPPGCRPLCSPALPPVQAWQHTVVLHGLVAGGFAQRHAEHGGRAPPFSSAIVSPLTFHASPVHINRLTPKETRQVHGACTTVRLSNGEPLRRDPTLGLAN